MREIRIRLPDETIQELDRQAELLGISRAEIIRRSVDMQMPNTKEKVPLTLRRFQDIVTAVYRRAGGALRHPDAEHLTALVVNMIREDSGE